MYKAQEGSEVAASSSFVMAGRSDTLQPTDTTVTSTKTVWYGDQMRDSHLNGNSPVFDSLSMSRPIRENATLPSSKTVWYGDQMHETHLNRKSHNFDMGRPILETTAPPSFKKGPVEMATQAGRHILLKKDPGYSGRQHVKVKVDSDDFVVEMKNIKKDQVKFGDTYANRSSYTQSAFTTSIILQVVNQLRTVIKDGPDRENYWELVILLALSILVQAIGAVLILLQRVQKTKNNKQVKRAYTLNDSILFVAAAGALLTSLITAVY